MDNISLIGKSCCGCRACEQICGIHAISFYEDDEGFMCPVVDGTLCVGCKKCLAVCPVNHVNVFDEEQKGFAAKTRNADDLERCSSGGLFYVMAKYILDVGGVVCGCCLNKQLMPQHVIATSLDVAQRMRGSKYVQSNMDGVYTQLQLCLKKGIKVLFTGTPCQVAGLRNFLGVDYENLYAVDIICHGVPSRKLYASYLQWLEKKWGGEIVKMEFRSKKKHQWSLTLCVTVNKNGKRKDYIRMGSLDPYYYNFIKGNTYRESCYLCRYAQKSRAGDISIGDFWGVENKHPELFDIRGLSCALINSSKGMDLWGIISGSIDSVEVNPMDIVSNNGNLNAPTKRPEIRDVIYDKILVDGFGAIPYDIPFRLKLIDSIKNAIPNKYRYAIKKNIRRK